MFFNFNSQYMGGNVRERLKLNLMFQGIMQFLDALTFLLFIPPESPLATPSPGGTPSLKRGQRRRNRFLKSLKQHNLMKL